MKTVFKVLCGALVTGTLLLTAACGGGGGSSGALGEEVSFSGVQVYNGDDNGNPVNDFTGVTLTGIYSNDIHIQVEDAFDPVPTFETPGGKLTLEFGAPKTDALDNINSQLPAGVDVSDENAGFFNLMSFYLEKGGKGYDLGLGKGESDLAVFVYVDADVTINGSGPIDDMTGIWDLDLKAGWNTVLVNINEETQTMTQKSGGLNGYRWYMGERGNQS